MLTLDAWENLCNAVVYKAVKDWKLAVKRIKNSRKPSKADMITKEECEEFFLSDRFKIFTELDGKVLLEKLKEEYEYDW